MRPRTSDGRGINYLVGGVEAPLATVVERIQGTCRRRRLPVCVAALAAIFLGCGAVAAGEAKAPPTASTSGLGVAIDSVHARQYVFWRGTDGRIYEAVYAGRWRGPRATGWGSASAPAAAAGPGGRIYLAWEGPGGHVYEALYDRKWGSAQDLTRSGHWRGKGLAASAVALAVNPRNGNQFLLWRGTDGRIHEAWYTRKWHGPVAMPWPSAGAPAVAVTPAGRQYVFWSTGQGHIEEAWYSGAWHGPLDLTADQRWGEFGQSVGRPAVAVSPADDNQYLFWAAVDGHVYEAWYARGWHGPVTMGWSAASAPAVAAPRPGRQYVFWQGADGTVWESWYGPSWKGPLIPLRRGKGGGPDVEVAQTSASSGQRLARLATLRFGGPAPPGLPRIDVDDTARYQRILGVGGAMTDTSAWLIYDQLDAATRIGLMNDLFGTAGIHLSYTLVPMGASDFTRTGQPYTYDDIPAGQSDPQLAQFSIAHDDAYILPALREMLQINPQTMLMATPWTAPPWMKANDAYDDSNGAGTLLGSAYQAFANYFVRFLQAYAAEGVPVGAIVPDNEPNSAATFPSMAFTASGEAQWITQNLEPALDQAGLHPRLYGGDVGWAAPYYPSALVSSPANGALTGVAWHCYGGMPTVMSSLHAQVPADDQIVTECSQGIAPYPVPEVLIGSLRNWSSAVMLWNLALDPSGGPVQPPNAGCPHCTGEVTIDEATQSVTFRLAYFQLGQVSAFVQPGAWRIGSKSFVSYYQTSQSQYGATQGLDDVAFLNPDGSRVLVAYNNSPTRIRFAVTWAGRAFTYSLPAKAMVTFRWAA
jgi:glucosylceramidase